MQHDLEVLDGIGRMGLGLDRPWYRSDLRQRVHSLAEKRGGLADPPPRAMRERACEIYETLVLQLEGRDSIKVSVIGPPPTRKQVRSMKRAEMNDGRRMAHSLTEPEVERLERTRREVIINSCSGVAASWTNRSIGPAIELTVSMRHYERFAVLKIPDAFIEYHHDKPDEILQRALSGQHRVRMWTCPWKDSYALAWPSSSAPVGT